MGPDGPPLGVVAQLRATAANLDRLAHAMHEAGRSIPDVELRRAAVRISVAARVTRRVARRLALAGYGTLDEARDPLDWLRESRSSTST